MTKVAAIPLTDGGYLYVEMTETDMPGLIESKQSDIGDLPEGAELTGVTDRVVDTLRALRDDVSVVAKTVRESFVDDEPEELKLEFNIGFKGKASPIPVILSGEVDSALKLTAHWKKNK